VSESVSQSVSDSVIRILSHTPVHLLCESVIREIVRLSKVYSNDNGTRVVNSVIPKYLIAKSKMFSYRNIQIFLDFSSR